MRSFLRRWFRPLAAAVAVLGLAAAVWGQADAIAAFDWHADAWAVLAAVGLLPVAPCLQALTWVWALRRGGAAAPWVPALRVWARSFLLRYEPSGAVGFAYRVHARERLSASTPQVLVASAYEQLAAVVAGALATLGGFALAGLQPPVPAWALAAGALTVAVAARPAFLGRWAAARLAARGISPAVLLPSRVVSGMVGVNALGWAATGLGAWLLVGALGVDVDAGLLLGAYALSWLLGVLVPLAPGGLGLRDGSLVLSLAATAGTGVATALALALRLVSFAGELFAAAALELVALALARAGATHDRPPAPATASALPSSRVPMNPQRLEAHGHSAQIPAVRRADTVVVVPTYDEAEALPLFVARFATTGLELLIVDDGSPDGTGELADALAAERPWMHVLHRASKDGLGMAYRAGFTWALERGYSAIGQMDCDLSHPPETLAELLAVLHEREADLVIANRYLPGGGTQGWSRGRRLLSRVGCTGSKLVLGLPFDDLSGGFKLWRAQALAELDFDAMLATGYAFQVETTLLAHLMGKRIEEVPFVFSERVAGASKMSLAISLEGVRVTLGLRRAHARARPL